MKQDIQQCIRFHRLGEGVHYNEQNTAKCR